jgi:hypothetical protein
MIGEYLSTGAAPGSEWIAAGYLLLPLFVGALFGGAFTYLIRWLGWPPNVISITPISIMFGVLSYAVVAAIYPMVAGSFTPQAIWRGTIIALVITWPITFVMGPISLIYIVQLKRGRRVLKDSTVLLISFLCLISELAFVKFFLDDTS